MNENIQIDPEFQSLVPALTQEEYKQLEDKPDGATQLDRRAEALSDRQAI